MERNELIMETQTVSNCDLVNLIIEFQNKRKFEKCMQKILSNVPKVGLYVSTTNETSYAKVITQRNTINILIKIQRYNNMKILDPRIKNPIKRRKQK